jgi:non-heme chloroperoxidase
MPYLQVEGDRSIYFEDFGRVGKPVLLVHAWALSLRVWDTMLAPLCEAGYRPIAFDQRACGVSDKDFEASGIDEAAEDAVRLLNHLHVERTALVGWSLGGAVATAAADKLESRCTGLVLSCGASPRYTSAQDFPHGGTRADLMATIGAMTTNRPAFFDSVARAVCAKDVGEPTIAWFRSLFLQASPGADRALADLADLDQREILRALRAPLLAITGGHDLFTPAGIGEVAAALAPRGRQLHFPDCGHAPQVEDFERYRDGLLAFLNELDF